MNEIELLESMNDLFVTAFPFILKHDNDDDFIMEVDVVRRYPVSHDKDSEYSPLSFIEGYLFVEVIFREIDFAISQRFSLGEWNDIKTFDRFEIFFHAWKSLIPGLMARNVYEIYPTDLFYKSHKIFRLKRELTIENCSKALRAKHRLGKHFTFNNH